MSLTATATSPGDTLRTDVLIGGRHHLVTDEPVALGGTDCGPNPHELLPTALAACIIKTVGFTFDEHFPRLDQFSDPLAA